MRRKNNKRTWKAKHKTLPIVSAASEPPASQPDMPTSDTSCALPGWTEDRINAAYEESSWSPVVADKVTTEWGQCVVAADKVTAEGGQRVTVTTDGLARVTLPIDQLVGDTPPTRSQSSVPPAIGKKVTFAKTDDAVVKRKLDFSEVTATMSALRLEAKESRSPEKDDLKKAPKEYVPTEKIKDPLSGRSTRKWPSIWVRGSSRGVRAEEANEWLEMLERYLPHYSRVSTEGVAIGIVNSVMRQDREGRGHIPGRESVWEHMILFLQLRYPDVLHQHEMKTWQSVADSVCALVDRDLFVSAIVKGVTSILRGIHPLFVTGAGDRPVIFDDMGIYGPDDLASFLEREPDTLVLTVDAGFDFRALSSLRPRTAWITSMTLNGHCPPGCDIRVSSCGEITKRGDIIFPAIHPHLCFSSSVSDAAYVGWVDEAMDIRHMMVRASDVKDPWADPSYFDDSMRRKYTFYREAHGFNSPSPTFRNELGYFLFVSESQW